MNFKPKIRIDHLLLFAFFIILSGCRADALDPRFREPPTSIATSIEFEDKIQGEALGGTISVVRALDDSDASAYILRWGSNGAVAQTNDEFTSNFIHRFEITGGYTDVPYEYQLYIPTPPPVDLNIDSIMVFTTNTVGDNSIGIDVALNNLIEEPLAPIEHPVSVSFEDGDSRVTIQGTIEFQAAVDETSIDFYTIRYADESGCPLQSSAIAIIEQGQAYSYTLSARTAPSSARSFVVLASNQYGEAAETDCSEYSASDHTVFNQIVPSMQPYYMAKRVKLSSDSDDTSQFTATLEIQGGNDERDLSTGYYVNLLDDSTGECSNQIAYFPKIGKRLWHTFEFTSWLIPENTTNLLISTGTECGFAGGEPHRVEINNSRGNWYLIKSVDTELCLSAEDSEPTEFPDNDGLSSHLRMVSCDAYDTAQRFTVSNLYLNDQPNSYVVYRVASVEKGGCLWRRDNAGEQEWQLMKACDDSVETQIQIMSRNDDNGRRNKTMAARNQISTDPDAPAWEYSCIVETGDKLISGWNNCNASNWSLFNFAPAGTANVNEYSALYDQP
jgi:hypothetical protein